MDKDSYSSLQKLAHGTYFDYQAGVYTVAHNDKGFKKYMDKPYRFPFYEKGEELYMTHNEKYFQLIGFIDAIVWLSRCDALNLYHLEPIPIHDYEDIDDETLP
ncbi:hypothetical protein AGMMS49983_20250 [Clostridia bacterium]|nr:hypothetical protein AGMMS49983_20250 [Clostridia bacterium]